MMKTQTVAILVYPVPKLCLKKLFVESNLLETSDNSGWTVAHQLAIHGDFPLQYLSPSTKNVFFATEEEIFHFLMANDEDGFTIFHALAESNTLPEKFYTEEILSLIDLNNETVGLILITNHGRWDILTPELLGEEYYDSGNYEYFHVVDLVLHELYDMDPQELERVLNCISIKSLNVILDVMYERDL